MKINRVLRSFEHILQNVYDASLPFEMLMFNRSTKHVFEDFDSLSLSELHKYHLKAFEKIQTE